MLNRFEIRRITNDAAIERIIDQLLLNIRRLRLRTMTIAMQDAFALDDVGIRCPLPSRAQRRTTGQVLIILATFVAPVVSGLDGLTACGIAFEDIEVAGVGHLSF